MMSLKMFTKSKSCGATKKIMWCNQQAEICKKGPCRLMTVKANMFLKISDNFIFL